MQRRIIMLILFCLAWIPSFGGVESQDNTMSALDQELMGVILTGNPSRYNEALVVNEPQKNLKKELITPSSGSVRDLLERGANPNAQYVNGYTALMLALEHNQEDAVKALIEHGADVNAAQKDDSTTALHVACKMVYTQPNTIELLVNHGAKLNPIQTPSGFTPLMLAVSAQNIYVVEVLLKNGADVNCKTSDGFTALSIAKGIGDNSIIELLIDSGAKE